MAAVHAWYDREQDADPETCLVSGIKAARKGHDCSACGKPIRPGQAYTRYAFPPSTEHPGWQVYAQHPDGSCDWS